MNILDYLSKGQDALLGAPNSYGGLIDEEGKKQAQQQARMMLAASLLEAGGPSSQPTNLGQALGRGMMAGQQAQQGSLESSLKAMLMKQQMAKAANGGTSPSGVREYEYAKANGYKGSFEEWKRVASAQAQPTSDIQNWEYFNKLLPDQQKQWMSLQRQPTAPQLAVINGVPTLVDRIQGTTTPLTTQAAENEAAAARVQTEAEAKGVGTALGEAKGAVEKRGYAAKNVNDILDVADPLIDLSTGSAGGAAVDKVAGFFGKSLNGAEAASQLSILQGALMFAQPRMEGPQGVLDVQLYEKMAGQIGDPTVPAGQKKAALKTIRNLYQKYATASVEQQGALPSPAKRPPLSSFQK